MSRRLYVFGQVPIFLARTTSFVFGICALGVAISLVGCGSPQSAHGPTGVVATTQRLQGAWRVQTFVPETQLELPLQGVLNAELGQLTITFQGMNYVASGPGINVNGRFDLQTADGELLAGHVYDSTGVGYRISGEFEGPALKFRSYDSPWLGSGTLVRAPR